MSRFDVYTALLLVAAIAGALTVRRLGRGPAKKLSPTEAIERFLAGGGRRRPGKPIIWVYVDREVNARFWQSFGSRNTTCLNAPYKLVCIRSIIERNSSDFDICILSDESLPLVLGEDFPSLDRVPEPARTYVRRYGMARVLHEHGGVLVPPSFACARSLYALHLECERSMFAAEGTNSSVTADRSDYAPSCEFMGCRRGDSRMHAVMSAYEDIARSDQTDASNFEGAHARVLGNSGCDIIPAAMVGIAKMDGRPVTVEELAGSHTIALDERAFGVWFPAGEIAERTAYQWISRLSPAQVLNGDTELGKISLALS